MLSNNFKDQLVKGNIDFDADVFKIIVMQYGFVFNPVTHGEYLDLSASELATGNGYTAGGITLLGVTVARDDVNNVIIVTWNSAAVTASGGDVGPMAGAIVFDDTATGDPIVGYIDFAGSYTLADGGTATITNLSFRI